jgi:ribosome biogenesis GTPase / thiamine phosphate phosphatase
VPPRAPDAREAGAPCTRARVNRPQLFGRTPLEMFASETISAVKKKKVRVALRKNRQNRTRANDLTRKFRDDELTPAAEPAVDRVRPRGELSRHRTIIEEVPEEHDHHAKDAGANPSGRRAVDVSACLRGRVVRVHGLISVVKGDDGRSYSCHVRRLLKTLAIEGRSVVTVGDHVWFRPGSAAGSDGLIEKVENRRGVITRGYRHRQHIIAANVDQVLVVSALAEPGLKLGLIDRYLISAETGGVRAVIVLNKADLVDLAACQWVIGLYAQLGYETVVTSVADGRGSARLRELLSQGVTAVTGQSGVGKSSLLNLAQPGLNLKVREVSDWTFKGKHTTTTAELIELQAGGFVVDTPGLRQFELWGTRPGELAGYFVEFRPYIPHCRFPDCSHTHETGCAVKDALHWGQIHPGRYESYRKLYEQQPLDTE